MRGTAGGEAAHAGGLVLPDYDFVKDFGHPRLDLPVRE